MTQMEPSVREGSSGLGKTRHATERLHDRPSSKLVMARVLHDCGHAQPWGSDLRFKRIPFIGSFFLEQCWPGSFAYLWSHRKFSCDQISDRVTYVRTHRVGFIQFDQRIAVRIRFPAHLLKIPDELLTVFVDHKAMLTGVIS